MTQIGPKVHRRAGKTELQRSRAPAEKIETAKPNFYFRVIKVQIGSTGQVTVNYGNGLADVFWVNNFSSDMQSNGG